MPPSSPSSAGQKKVGDEGIATTPTRSVENGPSRRLTVQTPAAAEAASPSRVASHNTPAHSPSASASTTPLRPRSRPQTPSSPAERSLEGVHGIGNGRVRLFSAEAHNTFFGNSMGAVPTTAEAAVALKQAALTIIGIHRFLSLLSANKLVEPNVLAFTETLLGNTDGSLGWVPSVFSRGGSLLPSLYADGRYIDDVIAF